MKECGKNWPSIWQRSSQMKLPPISQTSSALQHANGAQQTPLQQNCVPSGPHNALVGRAVQAIVLMNGLHVSHVLCGLMAPAGKVAPSIVHSSPPHSPQTAESAQHTSPG